MINIFKDHWAGTDIELKKEVSDLKKSIKDFPKTIGKPRPTSNYPIVNYIVRKNIDYTFINETEVEYIKKETVKLANDRQKKIIAMEKAERDKIIADELLKAKSDAKALADYKASKLKAETIPSPNYANYRESEYPSTFEQLESIWEALNNLKENGGTIGQQAETMLSEIIKIKNKYKKP